MLGIFTKSWRNMRKGQLRTRSQAIMTVRPLLPTAYSHGFFSPALTSLPSLTLSLLPRSRRWHPATLCSIWVSRLQREELGVSPSDTSYVAHSWVCLNLSLNNSDSRSRHPSGTILFNVPGCYVGWVKKMDLRPSAHGANLRVPCSCLRGLLIKGQVLKELVREVFENTKNS